jgi:uncharacterized protein (TIGR02466 family)
MLHHLFPTSIYVDKNIEILQSCKNMFSIYKDSLRSDNLNFRTTLKNYGPGKAVVNADILNDCSTYPLTEYIRYSVKRYLIENEYQEYDIEIPNLWINEMNTTHTHEIHSHYGCTLSGCYYVDCPEGSGIIQFQNPINGAYIHHLTKIKQWNSTNADNWCIPVEEGSIIIFPSYIKHGVPKLNFAGYRRSIAFDINLL